ncbi:MAG: pyridoxamine 5'-phosphate oxidase family protein [Aquihabitans sp.]
MSTRIDLADLPAAVAARGQVAYLLSVRGDHDPGPHVVSVAVEVVGDQLVVGAGRTTSGNVEHHPAVTLLWPLSPDFPDHSLVVDGLATLAPDGATISIRPTGAILHVATPSSPDRRC